MSTRSPDGVPVPTVGERRRVRPFHLVLAALLIPLAVGLSCKPAGADARAAPTYAAGYPPRDLSVPGGDPKRGRPQIRAYGCGACHLVPGVTGAVGRVGPPLTDWADRPFIAGGLTNLPDNLVRWIVDPPSIEPGTAMPDLGVSEADARDIAAYLYTLR